MHYSAKRAPAIASRPSAVAVQALQNWGCNDPKHSARLLMLGLPIELIWNFQTWKFHQLQCRQISPILKCFDQHNKVIWIKWQFFCWIMPNWGVQSQKLRSAIAPPAPT